MRLKCQIGVGKGLTPQLPAPTKYLARVAVDFPAAIDA